MASLLDRSLDDIARQNGSANGRRTNAGQGGRGSPYAKKDAEGQWKHDMYDSPEANASRRSTRSTATSGGAERTSRVLTILNLHYEVSERELEVLFAQIGPLDGLPKIKFDRSGRSQGEATVKYEKAEDAVAAKRQFDGANAKGQPIEVRYDMRFADTVPIKEGSLLSRVQGGVTLARQTTKKTNDALPYQPPRTSTRPLRTEANPGSQGRGGRGRGGPVRGVGSRAERPEKSKPKTADDLDKELEDFMNTPLPGVDGVPGEAPVKNGPVIAPADPQPADADVDMAA